MTAIPSRPALRSSLRFWGMALAGSAVLAASAQVSLPMWPVPATLQTLAVLLLGALGGSRMGVAAVLLYLAEGAMGLPVFSHGTAGPAVLAGPTGGFLIGFLAAAWIAGKAGQGALRQAATLTAAHLAVFVPGLLVLSGFVGWEKAWMAGFLLFVPGTAVKTALAFATIRALRRG